MATLPANDAQVRELFRRKLDEWAAQRAGRDQLVQAAYTAGLSKSEIARRTGLHRRTVAIILDRSPRND